MLAQEVEGLVVKDKKVNGVEKDTTDLYRKDEKVYKNIGGQEYKYNTFTSGSTNVHKFDNKERAFRDWSISLGGGMSFMHRGDLTSFYNDKITPGYNVYVSLDKQITHAVGVSLLYQLGETKQKGSLNSLGQQDIVYPNGSVYYNQSAAAAALRGVATAKTKYHQLSLLGDLNLSNLFRRMDNFSTYRWALHAYAGIGLQNYTYNRVDNHPRYPQDIFKQDLDFSSFFYQGGLGLKFNLNKWIDLEARAMYVITGDDEFDGGGETTEVWPGYNMIKKNDSDNMFSLNLGASFKLGRKENATHLAWYDPLKEIYYRIEAVGEPRTTVCENGDKDNDGVCDDWDRQLDTPLGARVDGAGVALDMDLDGVIDLYDKCVTVPGLKENNGCPKGQQEKTTSAVVQDLIRKGLVYEKGGTLYFDGIDFALSSAVVRPSSYSKLDKAVEIIKAFGTGNEFLVIGATDTRGGVALNDALSQRRAEAVIAYLAKKGVDRNILTPVGKGKNNLKYPECNPASKCPEWKNEANRRVYFEQK